MKQRSPCSACFSPLLGDLGFSIAGPEVVINRLRGRVDIRLHNHLDDVFGRVVPRALCPRKEPNKRSEAEKQRAYRPSDEANRGIKASGNVCRRSGGAAESSPFAMPLLWHAVNPA